MSTPVFVEACFPTPCPNHVTLNDRRFLALVIVVCVARRTRQPSGDPRTYSDAGATKLKCELLTRRGDTSDSKDGLSGYNLVALPTYIMLAANPGWKSRLRAIQG